MKKNNKKDTCDGCYHIIFDANKITMRCGVDDEIISKKRKRCNAYSTNDNKKYIR